VTGVQIGSDVRKEPKEATRPPRTAAIRVWRRHRDLLENASTLIATTGVTAVLGFAYWAFAARLFSQREVGYGSAAVSAMTLLGTIGMLGMGTVLIGELPRRRQRGGLVSAALIASAVGSLVLGFTFVVAAPHVSERFDYVSSTLSQAGLFVFGVILTGVSLVFDQATIGLLRGGLQLTRNMVFAAVKLLVLPAAAIILHDQFGIGILLAWVAGTAVSLVPISIRLWLTGTSVLPRPDWAVLRGLGRTALAHNWLNLSITVPQTLIPVLVTVVVSPSANAAFYAAWTLSGFLKIVPTHLSTVLFAIAAADPQVIARKLRFTLRLSLLIGLPGMAVLGLGAHLALSMFGPGYARAATVSLWLLVISYLPGIPKVHYMAVCRATGRIPRAAAVLSTSAALEVTAAAVGGASGGLRGLSFALVGVFFLEGVVTTPPVLRAAMGHGRHRHAEASVAPAGQALSEAGQYETPQQRHAAEPAHHPRVTSGRPQPDRELPTSSDPIEASKQHRQEAGMAALLSIARGQTAQSFAMSMQEIVPDLPDPTAQRSTRPSVAAIPSGATQPRDLGGGDDPGQNGARASRETKD
jgi:O-antigen/teichoic acid export membrane protein